MPAVHQHGQLHRGRTADVHERVERGADGAARVQHVVHEDDVLAVEIEEDVGGVHLGSEMRREVVAVEADVELAERHLRALDGLDLLGQALGEQIAPRHDADERDVARALVRLEDLMRNARQRPLDLVRVHADGLDCCCVVHTHPFCSSAYRRTCVPPGSAPAPARPGVRVAPELAASGAGHEKKPRDRRRLRLVRVLVQPNAWGSTLSVSLYRF